jgi:hypothetical protein
MAKQSKAIYRKNNPDAEDNITVEDISKRDPQTRIQGYMSRMLWQTDNEQESDNLAMGFYKSQY